MPRSYPPEFRREVLDLVATGKPVAEIADSLGVSDEMIFNWMNQELMMVRLPTLVLFQRQRERRLLRQEHERA